MRKLFIKNRKGQRIAVLVEGEERAGPLVFAMHGLSGKKEEGHIHTFAKAFLQNGFTVVRFDTTNSFGESDGRYEDATLTNYYNDLEDVVFWASKEAWYREPFWLAGHSYGGVSTILFAEKYPKKVAALAPISTVVSGKLSMESGSYKNAADEWKKTGWLIRKSEIRPGLIKKLPWSHMVDRMKYDVLPEAKKLTMPVLLIVGELDSGTPPEHQKLLFDALAGPKEMHIIKGAKHTFIKPQHLAEVKRLFDGWIKKHQQTVVVKETQLYGLGLFATQNMKKGTVVASFDGEVYEAEKCSALPNDSPRRVRDHAIQFEKYKWRDSHSIARLANHSCEPNCGIKNLFAIVAMRDIKQGEEITWDYEVTEDSDWEMKCKCGVPTCRKVVRAYRYMPEYIKQKYKGYISDWLIKKYEHQNRAKS